MEIINNKIKGNGWKVRKEVTGNRYGKWVVQDKTEIRDTTRYVECLCDCGVRRFISLASLTTGRSKSCGCVPPVRKIKHGLRDHPLYNTLNNMKDRCYDKNNNHYPYYGGKGVTICDEWLYNFKNFYDWCIKNGWQKGLEIDKDKIAMELGVPANLYSPERCQFLTKEENSKYKSNSTRIEYKGEVKSVAEWSIIIGISWLLLKYRIKKWGVEMAFSTPVLKKGTRKIERGTKIYNENIYNAETILRPKRSVIYNRNVFNTEIYFKTKRLNLKSSRL